jgi:metal-responsive CopG/Arc/MetJ family transcriptional regulator
MRALIDIDEKQIQELDKLARDKKRSRASLIREAVADYLQARSSETVDDAFGLWGKRKVDGLAYQEKIRTEW